MDRWPQRAGGRSWTGGDINQIRALAQELVHLQPDIIVTGAIPATVAVQRETRTIPIVFANVSDPVASGLVARLDRPGGNVTGFANFEATLPRYHWIGGHRGCNRTITCAHPATVGASGY